VFLEARERIQNTTGEKIVVNTGAEIHGAVIDKLKELRHDSISDKLFQLRRWRNCADYNLTKTIDQSFATKSLQLARDIYNLLLGELP